MKSSILVLLAVSLIAVTALFAFMSEQSQSPWERMQEALFSGDCEPALTEWRAMLHSGNDGPDGKVESAALLIAWGGDRTNREDSSWPECVSNFGDRKIVVDALTEFVLDQVDSETLEMKPFLTDIVLVPFLKSSSAVVSSSYQRKLAKTGHVNFLVRTGIEDAFCRPPPEALYHLAAAHSLDLSGIRENCGAAFFFAGHINAGREACRTMRHLRPELSDDCTTLNDADGSLKPDRDIHARGIGMIAVALQSEDWSDIKSVGPAEVVIIEQLKDAAVSPKMALTIRAQAKAATEDPIQREQIERSLLLRVVLDYAMRDFRENALREQVAKLDAFVAEWEPTPLDLSD